MDLGRASEGQRRHRRVIRRRQGNVTNTALIWIAIIDRDPFQGLYVNIGIIVNNRDSNICI